MTRTTRLLTTAGALASVFLLLAACDGGSGGAGGGGGAGACAEYANALTSFYDRCGDGVQATIARSRARLEAACARAVTAPGATNVTTQISACAQQISGASCSGTDDIECEFTGGTLDDGAACGESFQCKSGACETEPNSNCGKCAPRVAVGGDCTTSTRCVEDAECLLGSEAVGKCVAVKIAKAGEKCAGVPGEIVRCDKGLDCSFGEAEATCKPRGGAGADCSSRSDCQDDLRCVGGKCAAGAAEGAECSLDECGKGLGCGSDKKCARFVSAKAGEDCDAVRLCERGTCRGLSLTSGPGGQPELKPGKCVDPLPDGADCSQNTEEEDGPRCDLFAECIAGKCTLFDPAQCK